MQPFAGHVCRLNLQASSCFVRAALVPVSVQPFSCQRQGITTACSIFSTARARMLPSGDRQLGHASFCSPALHGPHRRCPSGHWNMSPRCQSMHTGQCVRSSLTAPDSSPSLRFLSALPVTLRGLALVGGASSSLSDNVPSMSDNILQLARRAA